MSETINEQLKNYTESVVKLERAKISKYLLTLEKDIVSFLLRKFKEGAQINGVRCFSAEQLISATEIISQGFSIARNKIDDGSYNDT